MAAVLLNVSDVCERSSVNGPGTRSVVWVQGCRIRCPGCFNAHTHAHRRVHLVDPQRLGGRLAAVPDTDGLTVSGGEPFEQAEACAALAAAVRALGLTVMVFTGYQYAFLRRSTLQSVRHFLANIDLLVAGPYMQRLRTDGSSWRGSLNQTLHVLTPRGTHALRQAKPHRPTVELETDGRNITYTGFPASEDRRWLKRLARFARSLTPDRSDSR